MRAILLYSVVLVLALGLLAPASHELSGASASMTSRGVLNLAMLAVMSVLAWLAISVDEPERSDPRAALTELDTRQIRHIRLHREGAKDIEFGRENDGWVMRSPIAFPADDFLMEALLGILRAPAKRA